MPARIVLIAAGIIAILVGLHRKFWFSGGSGLAP